MPPRLAQSAFELFADSGFANVNLDQIAARAGVTKGSLYWHYKSKKDLILAACEHYYRQWQTDVQKAIAPAVTPQERLRLALVFSVNSCVIDTRNRLFTTGIFMLMQEDAEVRASWSRFYDAVRAFYVELVTSAQRDGSLAAADARRDVDLMLEAMEGLKLRAGFEPHIARPGERKAIVEGLFGVLQPLKRHVIGCLLGLLACAACADLRFTQAGAEYRFDTGALRGTLRAGGRSRGIGPVTDAATGFTFANGTLGLLGPYRLLDAERRYLPDAREWASSARLLPDGAVEVRWTADAQHPFDLQIVYRWAASNALDAVTTVTARQPLRQFEVFMASYFQGFPTVYGYTEAGFAEVTKAMGDWLSFPRDAAAEALIADGRWLRPPHPVTFKPVARYQRALGVRRDPATGLAGLMMARPADCFAVLMPYGEEGHRSLYLSLFGWDFKAGEAATAHARLVIARNLLDPQAAACYDAFLKETMP
jgi:AcrR family transcriptional regulator